MMRRRRIVHALAALMTTAVLAPMVMDATAGPAGALNAPAYSGDFPDPTVITVGSGTSAVYAAYATGSNGMNLQVMTSPDLATWSQPADPLPNLPSWAAKGNTWAPSVIQINGTFVMYYTVRDAALSMQCISVATSPTALGPFQDKSAAPLICQTSHGGSIDPSVLRAGTSLYLTWKSDDNAIGSATTYIWSQQLVSSGLGLTGRPARIFSGPTQTWQKPVVEGPSLVALPGGGFGLFYGAGWWDNSTAAVGYATCPTPMSACTNQSVASAWLGTNATVTGPAGPALFSDAAGVTRLAFHSWTCSGATTTCKPGSTGYGSGAVRSLSIGIVDLSKNPPALQ